MKTIKVIALLAATSMLYACGGSSGGGGGGGSAGNSTLKLNGGSAFGNISSQGGNGGDIYFDNYGDVKVMKSGTVDVSFTVPTPSPTFGNSKATVFSNTSTSVLLDPTPGDATGNGRLFQKTNDTTLYVTKSAIFNNASTAQVSGLEVQVNAKLKLSTNYSNLSYVTLPKAVVINGTVTTIAESIGIDLESYASDGANYGDTGFLKIGPTGKVTTKPATAGANGGDIYLYSGGMAINQGVLDASGADGAIGGSAGYAYIDTESFIYNTGSMLSNGGAGSAGKGGSGKYVYLYSNAASIYTSGTLTTNGGAAVSGTGGSGGYIAMYTGDDGYLGRTTVGGTLTANGGNATNGNGGSADYIDLYTYGSGALKVNATITAKGGSSTGTGFSGGSGADLYLFQDYESDYGYGEYAPLEGIKLAGSIDLSGGSGELAGGTGGDLDVDLDNYNSETLPPNATIELYGYASFSMNGGDGARGGDAGDYEIYTEDAYAGGVDFPVGAILSEPDVSAKGGNGSSAAVAASYSGGHGGYIYFEAEGEMYAGTTTMTNTGNIDVSGGMGDFGGNSGGVYFYGFDKMTNNGDITANGGNGTTTGGIGGSSSIEFYSTLDVVNTGAINASGGSGATGGEGCDYIVMYAGSQLNNSGAITANGGVGTTNGGNGGYVDLFSEYLPTINSGTLSVAKGTGGTTAMNGWIFIDLVDVGPAHDLPAIIPIPE